jgi:hypothetical protein
VIQLTSPPEAPDFQSIPGKIAFFLQFAVLSPNIQIPAIESMLFCGAKILTTPQ